MGGFLNNVAQQRTGRQRVAVLGATGSIGVNTLDVIARHPDRYEVLALSAATRVDELFAQCARFAPRFAVMTDAAAAKQLSDKIKANGLKTVVLSGTAALEEIAAHEDADAVMAAIVGAAGLAPCLAAAHADRKSVV